MVTTGEPGTDVSVSNSGTENAAIFDFTIPKGEKGEQGEPGALGEQGPIGPQGPAGQDGAQGPAGEQGPEGPAGKDGVTPVISVLATTLEAGSEATVSKSGGDESPTFTFGIPRGATGDTGPQGEPGPAGSQGPKGDTGEQGPVGPTGADGKSATITIGQTTTGEPGSNASVTNTGDELNAVLSFTIPRGAQGETGLQGPPGQDGTPGADGKSAYQIASENGYTGSEVDFNQTLAGLGDITAVLDAINGEVV